MTSLHTLSLLGALAWSAACPLPVAAQAPPASPPGAPTPPATPPPTESAPSPPGPLRAGRSIAPRPWRTAPFTAPPLDVVRAADALSAHEELEVLFEERRVRYDADAGSSTVYAVVYRVGSASAAADWTRIAESYLPGEARPRFRVRVSFPDGRAVESSDADAREVEAAPESDSARRWLVIDLPELEAGAVVEHEVLTGAARPLEPDGEVRAFWFGGPQRVHEARLVIDHPAALALHLAPPQRPGVRLERREAEGRVEVVVAGGPFAPDPAPEPDAPIDTRGRCLHSTVPTWAASAAALAARAEAAAPAESLAALVDPALVGRAAREVAAAALATIGRGIEVRGGVPWESGYRLAAPEEVLARRAGSALDLAGLVLATLRAHGVEAHLALARSPTLGALEVTVPGLACFDRPLVHVAGTPPIWIDPSQPFLPPGALPAYLRDRPALVGAPGVAAPTRTPATDAPASAVLDSREIVLAAHGPARVREEDALRGELASWRRAEAAVDGGAELAATYRDWALRAFRARDGVAVLDGLEPSDEPLRIRIDVEGAAVGASDDEGASAELSALGSCFDSLPGHLLERSAEAPREPRQQALRLPRSFVYVVRCRVVAPPGYALATPRALPKPARWSAGPASFVREVRSSPRAPIGARLPPEPAWVEVEARFDTGHGAFTAGEAERLRTKVLAELDAPAPVVRFDNIGIRALRAGNARAGLALLREAAASRPDDPDLRAHVALALLEVGLGEAARTEARRAAELAPGHPRALEVLARALEHDPLGRPLARGYDRAGALEARRALVRAAPDDRDAAVALARLLCLDRAGERLGAAIADAELDEARAIYARLLERAPQAGADRGSGGAEGTEAGGAGAERAGERAGPGGARSDDGDAGAADLDGLVRLPLVEVCLRAGRAAEAAAHARAAAPSPTRDRLLLAALALAHGAKVAATAAEAAIPDPEAREAALRDAGDVLANLRRPEVAEALLHEAARRAGWLPGSALRARGARLGAARRYDADGALDRADPAAIARRFWARVWLAEPGALAGALARELPADLASRAAALAEPLAEEPYTLRAEATRAGAPLEAVLDRALAEATVEVAGDPAVGVAVTLRRDGRGWTCFLAPREGGLWVVASAPGHRGLGLEHLRSVRAGRLDHAARWAAFYLGPVALAAAERAPDAAAPPPDAASPSASDHLLADADRLWAGAGLGAFAREAARGAANAYVFSAWLLAYAHPDEALAALAASPEAERGPYAAAHARIALLVALAERARAARSAREHAERWGEALAEVRALPPAWRRSRFAAARELFALFALERAEEARARLADAERDFPGDPFVERWPRLIARAAGDPVRELAWTEARLATGDRPAWLLNDAAWLSLFAGEGLAQRRFADLAREAAASAPSRGSRVAALHTAACILIDLEPRRLGLEHLREAVGLRGGHDPVDDYVVGRLAEHVGEREAAIRAYRRVLAAEARELAGADGPASRRTTARLAERRLAALDGATGAGPRGRGGF